MKEEGIYHRWLKEKKEQEKIEKIKEKYNITGENKIVIEEKSAIEKIIRSVIVIFSNLFKLLLIISIFILSSIGATVLLNESLRNTFFQIIQTIF